MEGKHIRLLLKGNNTYQKRESLLYLDYLHPDPAVFFYFAGFCNAFQDQVDNPNLNWKTNAWNAERANIEFKKLYGI